MMMGYRFAIDAADSTNVDCSRRSTFMPCNFYTSPYCLIIIWDLRAFTSHSNTALFGLQAALATAAALCGARAIRNRVPITGIRKRAR